MTFFHRGYENIMRKLGLDSQLACRYAGSMKYYEYYDHLLLSYQRSLVICTQLSSLN